MGLNALSQFCPTADPTAHYAAVQEQPVEYVLPICSDPAPVWKVHCCALHCILLCCPEHAKTLCAVTQDVSFWLPETGFTENNLCEVVRSKAGDLVESVSLTDEFTNPKKGKTSNCFRIAYRSMERSLTDEEINTMQVCMLGQRGGGGSEIAMHAWAL